VGPTPIMRLNHGPPEFYSDPWPVIKANLFGLRETLLLLKAN